MEPTVLIEKLARSNDLLIEQFYRSFGMLSLGRDFTKARAVFIKPNLTFPEYSKGVTTSREFLEALIAALREVDMATKIYIGEGEGGYNSFSMSMAFEKMGIFELEKEFPAVEVVNLSQMPSRELSISTRKGPYRIRLPEIFFEEIDFSISCPLPKVHCMTKVTLAYKNQWGCLPDVMRLKNHYMFDHLISKLSQVLKFRYAFLDGKYGLDKYGPMAGDPVRVDWFVASNSLGAFDMTVAGMMGFDWKDIGFLRVADEYGLIPSRDEIDIIRDEGVRDRRFDLKRGFWSYPALAAFKSRRLTQLFYLSAIAKPLHGVMYLFRKRPTG